MGEDPQGIKAARASRISRHMSYQLLSQDEQWEEDTDRRFIVLPIIGCAFKKTYWDPLKKKNCSRLVLAETIDYGIMENAKHVAVLPAGGLGWSDVGYWSSLFEILYPDLNGNVAVTAQYLAFDSHNTLVYSNDSQRLVVTIGVDEAIIVDTGDVLLFCKSDQAQKVRVVVEHLKKNRQEKYL